MTFWKMSLVATVLLAPLAGRAGAAARELRLLAHSPQTDADAPTFEVASVKLNKSGDRFIGFTYQGGRFRAINATLGILIRNAYQVHESQISGGPSWLDTDRFDIVAKGDVGASPAFPVQLREGPSRLQLMIRALLIERFNLDSNSIRRKVRLMCSSSIGPNIRSKTETTTIAAVAAEHIPRP